MSRPLAVIIGAGVAGMSAAWWLGRSGWRSIVVERAEDLRDGGYMMGISGPGYETAGRMGLIPPLEKVSYAINENVYRDRRGRELLRLRYRDFLKDLPYLALRRNDLIRVLRDALDENTELKFGCTVETIRTEGDRAVVGLSDRSTIDCDLVIGADGFRSASRRLVFGEDENVLEHLGYRFAVFDVDDNIKLEADFLSFAEPGHLAEYYALNGGRLAAMHVWRDREATAPPRVEDRWSMLERVSATSHPMVRQFLKDGAAGDPPTIDSLTMVNLPTWHKGRFVLLGDAAHCLTLVSGQGAGMAMASSEVLAQELAAAQTVPEALAAHDRRLRPAITRLQQRSRRMAAIFIPESSFAFHARNFTLRHMPRAWLGKYFANSIRSEIDLVST
ncbi:FAD-dependent monooxygenase [Bradyrhizobium sp.]|uniref:FAD-dependent monooxygenase n=1 Tax=Bradyrhizobium sp. TaxID=376 RepID=UPI0039E6E660